MLERPLLRVLPASALGALVALAACGGPENVPAERADTMPSATDPAYAQRFDGEVDERISTSPGEEGGLVVLFPRVVTSAGVDAPERTMVHDALRAIGERVANGRPLDVRPEPERACPRGGCAAVSLGAVLLRASAGCAVVATVSQPGETPARLIAWAGEVELRNTNVPFREPPEQHIRVHDMVPCADLATAMMANEPEIEAELSRMLPGGAPAAEEASSGDDAEAHDAAE